MFCSLTRTWMKLSYAGGSGKLIKSLAAITNWLVPAKCNSLLVSCVCVLPTSTTNWLAFRKDSFLLCNHHLCSINWLSKDNLIFFLVYFSVTEFKTENVFIIKKLFRTLT